MTLALRFVLAALATWRLTHLLTREDGPFDIIARWRAWLGPGFAGRLIDCFQCTSFWVAAPVAAFAAETAADWPLVWLALSGAACLLERLGSPVAPVFDEDELLRTETRSRGASEPAGSRRG